MDGSKTHDQKRVVTPKQAIDDGADYLVIGREVTEDPEPAEALKRIIDSI